jgi:hypothetical protein
MQKSLMVVCEIFLCMELVYVWVPGYDTKARDALARAIEEHKKVLSENDPASPVLSADTRHAGGVAV